MAGPSASSLLNKVAIVSGSSSGIGAAIARELSRRGANVVVNYPTGAEKADAEKVLEGLQAAVKHIAVEADLSTLSGAEVLAEAAAKEFGRIDILINNAGRAVNMAFDKTSPELWDSLVNLNARGTFFLTQAVLKNLSPKNSRIVNITGAMARDPQPGLSLYSGTKGMIESFTRCWAKELPAKYGCTVNTVAPGPVSTPAMMAAPREFHESLAPLVAQTPVAQRMGEPEEIAWAVVSLCEESAGWVNGAYLSVSGGLYVG